MTTPAQPLATQQPPPAPPPAATPPPEQHPEYGQHTTNSLATKFRDKFPDGVASDGRPYAEIPDDELAGKLIGKHPVYQNWLKGEELQRLAVHAPQGEMPGHNVHDALSTFWQGIKSVPGGVAQLLDPTRGLSGAGLAAVGLNPRDGTASDRLNEVPAVRAAHEFSSARKDPTAGKIETAAAGPAAIVGISDEDARENAKHGQTGKIVGQAAVPLAMTAAGELAGRAPIGEAVTKGKGAVGTVLRDEFGKQKPAVKAVASLLKMVGGPEIADFLIPDRPGAATAAERKAVPLTQSPYYAQHEARVAQEAAAAKEAAKADAASRKAVPITQGPYYAQHQAAAQAAAEDAKPVPVTESPYYKQNRAKMAEEARSAREARKPVIVTPDQQGAGPRFVGSEGTAARWTNERVTELAKQGNREAIKQMVRRGMELPPNARYIAGDANFASGVYNPRDVTTFGPDGTPIRQGGKVTPVAQPFSGVRSSEPITLNPQVELVEHHAGPRANASGEPGGGGLEEQSRAASEKAQGVQYFREKPGGAREPLIGLGKQDLRAGPGQRIIRVDANGQETVLDAQPARSQAAHPFRKKPG